MSGKVSENINFKLLISVSNQIKHSWSIILFLKILGDQIIIDRGFWTSLLDGHIYHYFIYNLLGLILNLHTEICQIDILFSLCELLLNSQSWLCQFLTILFIAWIHWKTAYFYLIIVAVLCCQFVEKLVQLLACVHDVVEGRDDLSRIEESLYGVLIDLNLLSCDSFVVGSEDKKQTW